MLQRSLRLISALTLGLTLSGCGFASTLNGGSSTTSRAMSATSAYTLFIEPNDGVAPVLTAIDGAKRSVDLVVYMLTIPEVINGLIAAKNRGVQVRVMLEQKPYNPSNPNAPLPTNNNAFYTLRDAGVQVKWTSRTFTYTHEKAMVVDGSAAFIMTSNLTKSAFLNNREYDLIDREPTDVAETAKIFQADWDQTPYTPTDPDLVVSPNNSRSRLQNLIASAKTSIVIQDEVMGDPQISAALGERVKAGVQVRVQLAKFTDGDTNTVELAELNNAGVTRVRFLSKPVLHAKLIVVDGQSAYIGSINLTTNSMENNRELGVILHDPTMVRQLATIADKDWVLQDPVADAPLMIGEL